MVQNRYLGILGILLLIFIGGCSTADGRQSEGGIPFFNGGDTSDSDGNIVNNDGIKLTFQENLPPSKSKEGRNMKFVMKFENLMRQNVNDLIIRPSGFSTNQVSGLSEFNLDDSLPAVDDNGRIFPIIHEIPSVTVNNIETNFDFKPKFDYCYSAKTTFVQWVCVKDLSTLECSVDVPKQKEQSGPLAITITDLQTEDETLYFTVVVENRGGGILVNTCFENGDSTRDYNVDSVTFGSAEASCTEGPIGHKLVKESSDSFSDNVFDCEVSRTASESYPAQITVDLSYKYQEQQTVTIQVEDDRTNN